MRGLVAIVAGLSLWCCGPAFGVQAGVTFDVHQDIMGPPLPNDFHIEGLICSNNGTLPTLVSHIDGPFAPTLFAYTLVPAGLSDPCWYYLTANWRLPLGSPGIPYCTVIHLGLLFDVDAANVIIDVHGWWTYNGQKIGDIIGGLPNGGYTPQLGFNVLDTQTPQFIRIGNGFVVQPVPVPPPPPIQVTVLQMDVVPFPPGSPPDFNELSEFGQQQFYPWVPVVDGSGDPIGPSNPVPMAPDSFFDVFLEAFGRSEFRAQTPVTVLPGGFLVARQLIGFVNNNNLYEERWFWEIHGAQGTEACCLPDGTCQDLIRFNCLQLGGVPQGAGTNCTSTVCPEAEGACCYGTVAPQCIVTDQTTCEQVYLGQWKGAGTDCSDLDGDTIADICEVVQSPEACCLPDGTCQMLPPTECLALNGQPKGPGTRCLGDHNENGVDDICEVKWIQLPDLSVNGTDVKATEPLVLADDFLCTQRSRITDIRVWGSWRNDLMPVGGPGNVEFVLSIHADIPDPDGAGPDYSRPGEVLWFRTFVPGSFNFLVYQDQIQEGWWDPSEPGSFIFPGDRVCWEYIFAIPPLEAFCQEGSSDKPIVYWLDVQARVPAGPALAQFGWKTSTTHWNDDAVWGLGVEPYPGPWNELRYPEGHELHGQSIDLAFALAGDQPCEEYDFGDAPDQPYPTLLANNGARHVIVPGVFLGNLIDGEADGQPNLTATGDDLSNLADEDGVVFLTPLQPGAMATVQVTASVAGGLNAWMDFNQNGSWADPGEQIFAALALPAGATAISFPVPTSAKLGTTFARFRYTTAVANLPFIGLAPDGEVEDYRVIVKLPQARLIGARSLGALCDIDLLGAGGGLSGSVTDGRVARINRIRFTFDNPPVAGLPMIEESTTTTWPVWAPYSGTAVVNCGVAGNDLICSFLPKLENGRTYRFTLGPAQGISSIVNTVLARGLIGDVSSDGISNGTDRSVVIGVWTGAGWSCPTDLNEDGITNGTDRSIVIGVWTSGSNTAP